MITEMQKRALEIFMYENKDYDLVFDYLNRIGIKKEDYLKVLRSVINA